MKKVLKKGNDYRNCLLLDSGYMPRQIVESSRAYVISLKGNGKILHEHPECFGLANPELKIFRPSVIMVNSYININIHKVPFSRDAVFLRDNFTCVYCGEDDKRAMTLDHVLPKSKGGKDSFENCVTACKPCNQEKNDLTIEEWGKKHPNPKRPHYLMFLKNLSYIPEEWKKYLLW